VLCCAVLCCAVLCCAVLCCAVLCCAVLCCAVLCCAVLCCAVLYLCCDKLRQLKSSMEFTHRVLLSILTHKKNISIGTRLRCNTCAAPTATPNTVRPPLFCMCNMLEFQPTFLLFTRIRSYSTSERASHKAGRGREGREPGASDEAAGCGGICQLSR
jgi:hypothetical protein